MTLRCFVPLLTIASFMKMISLILFFLFYCLEILILCLKIYLLAFLNNQKIIVLSFFKNVLIQVYKYQIQIQFLIDRIRVLKKQNMQFSNIDNSSICPIFSPCAKYFAVFVNNNIYIKDAGCSDLKNYAQIPFKEKKESANIKCLPQLKFSPDSKLTALKNDKKLQIYDIQGNIRMKIKEQNYELQEFFWVQDVFPYQIIAFYGGLSHCVIYNLQTQQQNYIKNYKFKSSNGYSFSKGSHPGAFLAILQKHSAKDCIGIYYTRTFEMLNFITLDTFDAAKIQFTSSGDLIITQNKINFKIYLVDPFRGIIASYGQKDYCLGVSTQKLSNNQNFLALGVHDDCLHILNTFTWKPICELEITQKLDLSKTILHKQQSEQFNIIRQGKYKLPQKKETKESDDTGILGISLIQFSPEDDYLAVRHDSMSNCIFIYGMCNLELVTVIQTTKTVKDFKWLQTNDNCGSLCIVTGNKSIFVWKNINNQGEIFEIPVPSNNINLSNIELGKQGKMMFYSNGQKKYTYAMYDTGDSK